MYVNAKMIPVGIVPGIGEEVEFKCDTFDTLQESLSCTQHNNKGKIKRRRRSKLMKSEI
jgi:hypothetical protein